MALKPIHNITELIGEFYSALASAAGYMVWMIVLYVMSIVIMRLAIGILMTLMTGQDELPKFDRWLNVWHLVLAVGFLIAVFAASAFALLAFFLQKPEYKNTVHAAIAVALFSSVALLSSKYFTKPAE